MRRRFIVGGAIAGLMLLVLAGCSKSPVGPEQGVSERDLEAIRQLIDSDALFTSDASLLDDQEPVNFDQQSLGKTTTAILPRAWGRRITSVTRDVQLETVNDTTVVATIIHTLTGEVIILAKYAVDDTAFTKVKKPFTEVTTRKVKFHKVGDSGDPEKDWRPGEVSAVKGGTEGSRLVINKVEVTAGNSTLTITDPNEYFMKLGRPGDRPVPVMNRGQQVTVRVTLTSTDADTDWVSLHRPFAIVAMGPFNNIRPLHVRMKLVSQTEVAGGYERVFEHTWSAHLNGRHNVLVGALTRSSIFDDTAPFSSQLWGVPYIVQ